MVDDANRELEEYDNKRKHRLEVARQAVEDYEKRHGLPVGNLIQGEDTGDAPGVLALAEEQSPGGMSLGSIQSC